jgi:glycosyltransferase involved in cell wall biosynthesis
LASARRDFGGLRRSDRVCLVTPDLVGPIRNGGIGTFARNMAQTLVNAGVQTEILFTGALEESTSSWIDNYTRMGIRVTMLDHSRRVTSRHEWFYRRAAQVHEHLADSAFSSIIFQDWHANGYEIVRRKNLGNSFQGVRLIAVVHSPSAWSRLEWSQLTNEPLHNAKLDGAERYAVESADEVWFPSDHMRQWASSAGWRWRGKDRICGYPVPVQTSIPLAPASKDLVFFGRLEFRKGIHVFVEAIREVAHRIPPKTTVWFVGKGGTVHGIDAQTFVEAELAQTDLRLKFITDLPSTPALALLGRINGLVLCPSVVDNLPFAVIEASAHGLQVYGSDAGGIPEILPEEQIFPLTSHDMAALIDKFLDGSLPPVPANSRPWSWAQAFSSDAVRLAKPPEPDANVRVSDKAGASWEFVIPHWASLDRSSTERLLKKVTPDVSAILITLPGGVRPSTDLYVDLLEGTTLGVGAIALRSNVIGAIPASLLSQCSLIGLLAHLADGRMKTEVIDVARIHGRPCDKAHEAVNAHLASQYEELAAGLPAGGLTYLIHFSGSVDLAKRIERRFRFILPEGSRRRLQAKRLYIRARTTLR